MSISPQTNRVPPVSEIELWWVARNVSPGEVDKLMGVFRRLGCSPGGAVLAAVSTPLSHRHRAITEGDLVFIRRFEPSMFRRGQAVRGVELGASQRCPVRQGLAWGDGIRPLIARSSGRPGPIAPDPVASLRCQAVANKHRQILARWQICRQRCAVGNLSWISKYRPADRQANRRHCAQVSR